MINGIIITKRRGLNKGFGSKFRVGLQIRQETPEEGRRTHRQKRCEYRNEINSPISLNDRNSLDLLNVKMHKTYSSVSKVFHLLHRFPYQY